MSGDEVLVLVASVVASGFGILWWYARILRSVQGGSAAHEFGMLALGPPVALLTVFLVARIAGSFDVRDAPNYLFLYTVLGLTWAFAAVYALDILGISFRDDAIERRNAAAAVVVIACLIAHAVIYAGANIGNGPGWWAVVAPAFVGSTIWFLLWILVAMLCRLDDDITVSRDLAAGVRIAGYALALGLILARGAAGDWTSLAQTIGDFRVAWPVLPLTAAAIAIERILESRPDHYSRGVPSAVLIAAFYMAVAGAVVDTAGPLPHNPLYDGAATGVS
jgi:hypothetical protein